MLHFLLQQAEALTQGEFFGLQGLPPPPALTHLVGFLPLQRSPGQHFLFPVVAPFLHLCPSFAQLAGSRKNRILGMHSIS